MPTLRECQLGFARAVVDARGVADFGARIRARGLDASRRIQIYRNNRFASLTEALAAVYPVTLRLVGEPYFLQAATGYARAYPSQSGDIHDYGGDFGVFLRHAPGVSEHPYLPDVARLEWAYHAVFHSGRKAALDVTALSALPAAEFHRLRFHLQPAARLFFSDYPVLQIWQTNQDGWNGDQSVRLDAGGTRLLVRRDATGVAFHLLAAGEYALLEALAARAALGEAFGCATEADPAFDLAEALRRHVTLGTLIDAGLDDTAELSAGAERVSQPDTARHAPAGAPAAADPEFLTPASSPHGG